MSFSRFPPVFVSIVVSAGLWALGIFLMPSGHSQGGGRGGYAALICGEAVPDREIRERLENQGFSGLVSESGQWVLLDSFGSVERVPLDEYDERILPFDPRNDGYARKIRALFVQDGRRFIYIPIGSPVSVPLTIIEKRLAVALGDIPYSFEYAASSRSVGWFIVLFFLAAGAFLIMPPLRLVLQTHAVSLVSCLLALAPLALGGAAGLALASLLAGFAALLVSFSEQFALSYRRELPRTLRRLLPFLLMICYGIIVIVSGLSLVFTLLVLACLCGIVVFSLRGASRHMVLDEVLCKGANRLAEGHQRFTPVPILRRYSSRLVFVWAMLPFAAVAFAAAAFVPTAVNGAPPSLPPTISTALPAASLSEADYHAHYLFQSTFSLRSLRSDDASPLSETSGGMSAYELAPDGLLDLSLQKDLKLSGVPPFPLKDLLRYLEKRND